jgi:hypothetical protein
MDPASEDGIATGDQTKPIKVGRFAPYPAWMGVTLLVRGSQLVFLGFCAWFLAALVGAIDKDSALSLPPIWLWIVTGILGTSDSHPSWRWRTSPMGDAIGDFLASQQCPACGQNVFDHTPPSGYAPPSQRTAVFPSKICTNCGHDLRKRTA